MINTFLNKDFDLTLLQKISFTLFYFLNKPSFKILSIKIKFEILHALFRGYLFKNLPEIAQLQ